MPSSGYVDERIVQMQFENQQFERNANQSIGTLDKLKKADKDLRPWFVKPVMSIAKKYMLRK